MSAGTCTAPPLAPARSPRRRSRVLASDGTALAVYEYGSRSAPLTVIFTHGFGLRMASWAPQRLALTKMYSPAAVRFVFYDHRGHGRSSSGPDDHCTIEQLGIDLGTVIDTVAPSGKLVLAGHSMGGMTILSHVAANPSVTDRLAGFALISTSAGGLGSAGVGYALQCPALGLLHTAAMRMPGVVQGGWSLTRRLLSPVIGAPVPMVATTRAGKAAATTCAMLQQTPVQTLTALLRGFRSYDGSDALPILANTPGVVVCGTRDNVTPVAHSRRLAAALPQARLLLVDGARHMVELERAGEVTAILSDLIRSAASVCAVERRAVAVIS